MGLFGFGKPSKARFARAMRRALVEAGVPGPIEYDPRAFCMHHHGGEAVMNLHNAYEEYATGSRDERRRLLETWAEIARSSIDELPERFDEVQASILPRVREAVYYPLVNLRQAIGGRDPIVAPYRPLSDHLVIEACHDSPRAIRSLSGDELDNWNVDLDELLELSMANLWRISDGSFDSPCPGLHVSSWQDSHDASRMLLFDLIRDLSVDGDPVAFVPDRNHLIVAGSRDTGSLERAADLTAGILGESERPMTGAAHRLEGERWLPFRPAPGEPAHTELDTLMLQSRTQDYNEQRDLLNALHEQRLDDVFVADHQVLRHKENGDLASFCVWSQSVDALLPRTQLVALAELDARGKDIQGFTMVRWDQLAEVAGGLLEPTDHVPERYRVRAFPTKAQRAQLTPVDVS